MFFLGFACGFVVAMLVSAGVSYYLFKKIGFPRPPS